MSTMPSTGASDSPGSSVTACNSATGRAAGHEAGAPRQTSTRSPSSASRWRRRNVLYPASWPSDSGSTLIACRPSARAMAAARLARPVPRRPTRAIRTGFCSARIPWMRRACSATRHSSSGGTSGARRSGIEDADERAEVPVDDGRVGAEQRRLVGRERRRRRPGPTRAAATRRARPASARARAAAAARSPPAGAARASPARGRPRGRATARPPPRRRGPGRRARRR